MKLLKNIMMTFTISAVIRPAAGKTPMIWHRRRFSALYGTQSSTGTGI